MPPKDKDRERDDRTRPHVSAAENLSELAKHLRNADAFAGNVIPSPGQVDTVLSREPAVGLMSSNLITAMGDTATTSCERCRRRKIKCDRSQPCSACVKAGTHCLTSGSGEKQRPVPKSYVQALERSVASLELFIQQLAKADSEKRDGMLADYVSKSNVGQQPVQVTTSAITDAELVVARARAVQLRKLRSRSASQYFGGTGLFRLESGTKLTVSEQGGLSSSPSEEPSGRASSPPQLQLSPKGEKCQSLMAIFFKEQYPYHMCVYREFFLRDYDAGAGRYYSDVLLYAICSVGALAAGDSSLLPVSEAYANVAEQLVYASLDEPDLTLLQALILLGYRAVGHGKSSKGWLFLGMSFRLAHEMGLHLDPNNWDASDSHLDREILRRVYWAAFSADKQMSLYFGRPSALHPHESDVRNTIRMPYQEDWQGLLDTYIAKDIPATVYEDGISLVGSFIYRVELYKIVHIMITDLFENRRNNADSTTLAATAQRIHVQLNKWLATLPGKLFWNQWTSGQVHPFVLHLHMVFHTAMIVLHRPPHHTLTQPGIDESEDVQICYESLQAILRLFRSYSRYYKYSALPLDFVHTLSVTAGTILMKRTLQGHSNEDPGLSKSMDIVLDAMDQITHTWPCIVEVKASVVQALGAPNTEQQEATTQPIMDFGFLADISSNTEPGDVNFPLSNDGLGLLLTDELLMGELPWETPGL